MTYAVSTNPHKARIERVILAVLDGVSLKSAIKNEGMSLELFHQVTSSDRELAVRYASAMEFRGDILAGEIIEIADTENDAAKARNQITARQWLASKLNRKYGERVELNVSQTIDIGSTLAEARARMLRPMHDQLPTIDVQAIDLQGESTLGLIDKQSKRPIYQDIPAPDAEPDIFS
jgi:hypothetical protein